MSEANNKSGLKNLLQGIIGVTFGAFFLFITLRNKPLSEIFESVFDAKLFWVIMNAVLLMGVYLVRALRWNILLKNSDDPNFKNTFYSLLMGYFVNNFTPKFGEIIRCTSLSKSENIPFSKSLGSVITERIYDLLVLLLGLVVIFFIEFKRLGNFLIDIKNYFASLIGTIWSFSGIVVILSLIILAVGVIIVLKKVHFYDKVKAFIIDIIKTVRATVKTKQYGLFLLYTILIWLFLVLMNYCSLLALKETDSFSVYFALVILMVGGIGWAIPSPGGIGTSHFFILQLFILFGINQEVGVSFGILSNGLTFIFTLIFGIIAFLIRQLKVWQNAK